MNLCGECGESLSQRNISGLCRRCFRAKRAEAKAEARREREKIGKERSRGRETEPSAVNIRCKCGCTEGFSGKEGGPEITTCINCHRLIQV